MAEHAEQRQGSVDVEERRGGPQREGDREESQGERDACQRPPAPRQQCRREQREAHRPQHVKVRGAVADGVELKSVDSAARKVLAGYDLPLYKHGTGHGLGLEVHEAPVVSAKSKGALKAGEIITIEPGVYMPGKLGVRIEDDVLVTKTGCRILSR